MDWVWPRQAPALPGWVLPTLAANSGSLYPTIVHEGITINPKVSHGQACIKGTRIPVQQVFRMLANGDSTDSLLLAYPALQREDILACFDYAAVLAHESVTPLEPVGSE